MTKDIGNDIVSITEQQHEIKYEYNITKKPLALIPKTEYLLYARYEKTSI